MTKTFCDLCNEQMKHSTREIITIQLGTPYILTLSYPRGTNKDICDKCLKAAIIKELSEWECDLLTQGETHYAEWKNLTNFKKDSNVYTSLKENHV